MANLLIGASAAPGAAAVRDVLARIQESKLFCASQRQSDLLAYLVNEELEGRGDRLKSYSIAIDVFGRSADFDPASNSTVRVEMHRLRQALMLFNATEGQGLAAIIVLEPGAYRPRFEGRVASLTIVEREQPSCDEERNATGRTPTRQAEQDAAERTRRPHYRAPPPLMVASGIVAMLVAVAGAMQLVQHRSVPCESDRPALLIEAGASPLASQANELHLAVDRLQSVMGGYPLFDVVTSRSAICAAMPAYRLAIDLRKLSDSTAFAASVSPIDSDDALWTGAFSAPLHPDVADINLIAAQIAYRVGQSNGALAPQALADDWKDASKKQDYKCLLDAHALFEVEEKSQIASIKSCLERIATPERKHADAHGLLAALNYYILRGYWEGDRAAANRDYEAVVKAGAVINPFDREILIDQLRKARDREPIDANGIIEMTTIIANILDYDPHLLNQAARAKGIGLGDWQNAAALAEQGLLIAGDHFFIETTAYAAAIGTENWDRAQEFMRRFSDTEMDYVAMLNLATAARFNAASNARDAVATLARNGINGRGAIEASAVYFYPHESIHALLIAEIRKLPPEIFETGTTARDTH